MSSTLNSIPIERTFISSTWKDWFELTKPRITLLISISAIVSYHLGATHFSWILFLNVLLGTALTSGGASAFNHWMESEHDKKMKRTARRPIPSGKIASSHAFIFSTILSLFGIVYLFIFVNYLTGMLGALTWAIYVLIYTPFKRISSLNTIIGAFPGALPALGGYTAATGYIDLFGILLFLILFFWQFPHFLSIAWLYREDYAAGGYRMLSMNDDQGRFLSFQSLLYTVTLAGVSVLPFLFGFSGYFYLYVSSLTGLIFVFLTIRFILDRTDVKARTVLFYSFIYPLILWITLIIDKQN